MEKAKVEAEAKAKAEAEKAGGGDAWWTQERQGAIAEGNGDA